MLVYSNKHLGAGSSTKKRDEPPPRRGVGEAEGLRRQLRLGEGGAGGAGGQPGGAAVPCPWVCWDITETFGFSRGLTQIMKGPTTHSRVVVVTKPGVGANCSA